MSDYHEISAQEISIDAINHIFSSKKKLKLSADAIERIKTCKAYLEQKIQRSERPIYGVNTGFGSLHNHIIDSADLGQLQKNLVMSHACGTGGQIDDLIVRLMLFLKIQSLAYGNSGVQLELVERLIEFFNNGIAPVIYEQGSLGASGDLAPLAHLSLPLLGEGSLNLDGRTITGQELNEIFGWDVIELQAKEGLALLNGTQFMGAHGVYCIFEANRLCQLADIIGAISLDAFDGRIEPFQSLINEIRPHEGQIRTAAFVEKLLQGSELITQKKAHVQDPYSFRCIPQVHGASKDAIKYAEQVFHIEINSVTDNPNVFPEADQIISGGNFHGQPLALALDFLAIALAELGSISERRTFQLISGARELPHYLVANPGLNSGLMIPQYTAASIVSQNKQLCTPACVDSIVSSNGQEDHVSMGANAATKTYKVVDNVYTLLGIELLNAAQAMDFRKPLKTSPLLSTFLNKFREKVPFIEQDKVLHEDIVKAKTFIQEVDLSIFD